MDYVPAISNGTDLVGLRTRSGAFRSGAFNRGRIVAEVNGARVALVKEETSITLSEGGTPDTASTTMIGGSGVVPDRGQEIVIGHGTISNRLFSGRIYRAGRQSARAVERHPRYEIDAVGWEADLSRCAPETGYHARSLSVSSIIPALFAAALPVPSSLGITTTYVEPGLPVLAEFTAPPTMNLMDALAQLATMAGARYYLDANKRLHFYASTDPQPAPHLTVTSASNVSNVVRQTQLNEVVTRVVATGGQTTTIADTASDDERVPLASLEPLVKGTDINSIDGSVPIDGNIYVLCGGLRRRLVNGYYPIQLEYDEATYGANPISITASSFWVGAIAYRNIEGAGGVLRDRRWWRVPNFPYFRVDSFLVSSTTANTIYTLLAIPATGPGAPAPTAIGAVPAGTRVSAAEYEAELTTLTIGATNRFVIPAGTAVQAYHFDSREASYNRVGSLTGNAARGAMTATYTDGEARHGDLALAATTLLDDGEPDKHAVLEFETRDVAFVPGRGVTVTLPTSEPGYGPISGSFVVTNVAIGGFSDLAPAFGPIRRVHVGVVAKPSAYRLLKPKAP